MAKSVDYAQLRNHTLDSAQEEEAVTVNTRALIDKVLARYSGEWTTLRELIQNAADASATNVTIRFETLPSSTVPTPSTTDPAANLKHTVLHHTLQRLLVSNNGQAFTESDWSRLKRIAEGNPDETKIGAFGVGFYSVFAECESPFVTSGDQTMAFYWKGNSLFTRRGKLPEGVSNADTCFVLDYRNTTSNVPSLMSICQFLSTSLTFVGLETIELFLDDWNVFTLNKKAAPSVGVTIPKDIITKTIDGMMRITDVQRQNSQIDAQWMNIVGWIPKTTQSSSQIESGNNDTPSLRGFFSRLTGSSQANAAAKRAAKEEELAQQAISEDLMGLSRASVFTRVNTIGIKTNVAKNFAAELERATKKPPPKTTKIAILTSSYDEAAASMSTLSGVASKKVAEIVTSVLPVKAGRVFIGFPTAQTTGLLAHISAPSLIPTVERESIDLNARYVRTWNNELLNVAGVACRIAYAGEMATLRDKLTAARAAKGKLEESDIENVLPAAIHALKQYTFRDATPLAKVGEIIQQSFWTCNTSQSIEILSSRGILPSREVRIASEDLSFVKGVPVVPEELLKGARDFIRTVQDLGLVLDITTSDIKAELEKQAITEDQLHEFLKWAAKKIRCHELDQAAVKSLFAVTVANMTQTNAKGEASKILVLGDMSAYVNSSRISPDLPLNPDTVPFRFTKGLQPADLQAFGWEELQIVPWLRWLLEPHTRRSLGSDYDITKSANFSGSVLAIVSKAWDTSLSQSSKETVSGLLSQETLIPTRLGMRKPADSYFASVKLFDDLPTITNLNGVKEKLLKALGVRKTIELQVIFARLMDKSASNASDGKSGWSHVDLVRYLVSVWNDIPEQDIVQLRNTSLCPAQVDGDPSKATAERYKLSQLFEPKESLRGLGLSLLQWPGSWNSYSSEGKFLRNLGLRGYPSAPELVEIMSQASKSQQTKLYEASLQYYLENHYQNNYAAFDLSDVQVKFLPVSGGDKTVFVKPEDCFTDKKASLLGYRVLREDLQVHCSKLGVRANPPIADCALRLTRKPPQNDREAREIFSYFAGRLNDLTRNIVDQLSTAPIVPVRAKPGEMGVSKDSKHRLAAPSTCLLGNGETYGEIFDYVDFGLEPNSFLLRIGSKHEPTTVELTAQLIREPARIYHILGTEKYLDLLRTLHLNVNMLKKDKTLWRDMKKAPFLLCFRLVSSSESKTSPTHLLDADDDELGDEKDHRVREWRLRSADGCIVNDDYQVYRLFKDHIAAAPEDETIEELYIALGVPALSQLVEMEPRLGPLAAHQGEAEQLRELILERSRLFLHDQNNRGVKHDIKWLEKNLKVQIVLSVSMRRSLKYQNVSHTEKRSAALGKATLSITPRPDLWQISQEIVTLLVERPRPQTAMVLETFMTTSLYKLRSRGYNVDRILRRKAAEEARNAEIERQRREEEQKKYAQELERRAAPITAPVAGEMAPQSQAEEPHSHEPHSPEQQQMIMPGSFGDSPDRSIGPSNAVSQAKSKGILSSLSRRLGLDDSESSSNPLQKIFGQNGQNGRGQQDLPPPYTPLAPRPQGAGGHTNGTVTAPGNIQQNLQSAINSSRAHNSTTLFSQPQTNEVKETSSYCDSRPGQNLTLVSQSRPGVPVYIAQSSMDPTTFVQRNVTGLDSFASMLLDCGQIFGLRKETLHIFYDEQGNSIAFNSGGSIFCNYRYFAQLHEATMNTSEGCSRALVYWFVVLCHELAHNLVSDHGSNHSFYSEQFVAEYFPNVMGVLARYASQFKGKGQLEGQRQSLNGVERAFS